MLVGSALLVCRMRLLEMGDDTARAGGAGRAFAPADAGGGGAHAASTALAGPISFIALVAPQPSPAA